MREITSARLALVPASLVPASFVQWSVFCTDALICSAFSVLWLSEPAALCVHIMRTCNMIRLYGMQRGSAERVQATPVQGTGLCGWLSVVKSGGGWSAHGLTGICVAGCLAAGGRQQRVVTRWQRTPVQYATAIRNCNTQLVFRLQRVFSAATALFFCRLHIRYSGYCCRADSPGLTFTLFSC